MTEAQLRKIMKEVVDERLEKRLEQNNAVLFGQMAKHFDERLKTEIEPMKSDLNQIRATLDRDTKRIETDEQERAFIIGQIDRHGKWIGQLAKATNTKLVPEQ